MTEFTFAYISGLVIKIMALLTPTAILSAFLAYTRNFPTRERIIISCKTGLAIYIIGQLLLLCGPAIFSIFGFTLDAFRIGVGLLLFLMAIEIMNEDSQPPKPRKGASISVVPLAIPLGMGPATIGAVMVMGAETRCFADIAVESAALFMASMAVTLILCLAGQIEKLMGKTGILVMAKLTGLLISAIAAQVIFTGIRAFIK